MRSKPTGRIPKKPTEIQNVVKDDRISKLPEEILAHILSYLTTKRAVQASILSKQWRYIWTSVPNLVFDDRTVDNSSNSNRIMNKMLFVKFVNRVLDLNNVMSVHKFSISVCEDYGLFCISSWISDALTRDVEQITLKFAIGEIVKLPQTFFARKKLVLLDLGTNVAMSVPEIVDFPNLKQIHLYHVQFIDEDSMKRLLLGCPMLEDLTINIRRHTCDNIVSLHVSSSSLKRFWLLNYNSYHEDLKCKVLIDTPNLESFHLVDFGSDAFEVNISALSLTSVHLELMYNQAWEEKGVYIVRLMELLRNVSHTKYLELSSLQPFIKDEYFYNLPVFNKLNTLEVTNMDRREGFSKIFHHLLECSPNLHTLILNMSGTYDWSPSRRIPRCLQISLKEIVISVNHASDDDIIMAKFFLENGKVLKKMSIRSRFPRKKPISDAIKEVMIISKVSSECEVVMFDCGKSSKSYEIIHVKNN